MLESKKSSIGSQLLFVFKVMLARLRFAAILFVIGYVIIRWDDLRARYDKWVRPSQADAASSDSEYFCPMHPAIVRDNNKEKCPICFMPLSKRKKGETSDESLPAGTVSRVQLTPYRVVLAGIQTVAVGYQPLHKEITTVGTVEFDERGLKNVSARVKGRIDQLFVNQTGQMVHKGDPLASLYSPDLVVTVQNMLDARQAKNVELQTSARDRLRLWGIDDAQIDDILKTGKPITHITIRSPMTGHIIKKYQREGQYVEEGAMLYDVADLSTVWVQTRLYEEDLAFLPRGTHDPKTGGISKTIPVIATTRAFPGVKFPGVLSFLFPHVDVDSRTLTARFELKNPDHELRPGMTAAVTLQIDPELLAELPAGRNLHREGNNVLAVLDSSVIDTGNMKVVYREDLPGTFDGVVVELGSRLAGANGEIYYPVLKGVEPGDRVVTAGSFLIDAETRLNPAMGSIYIGGSGLKSGTGPTVRPTTPDDEEGKITAAFSKLSESDRKLAKNQRECPVLEGSRLGLMGKPIEVMVKGDKVFLCCKLCLGKAQTDPDYIQTRLKQILHSTTTPPPTPPVTTPPTMPGMTAKEEKIRKSLNALSAEDRAGAERQRLCPVTDEPLGSMGKPSKLTVKGQVVFTCCGSCNDEVLEKPDEMVAKVRGLTTKKSNPTHKE